MKETLRLFKAVPVTFTTAKKIHPNILKKTIRQSFVFSDIVMGNYALDHLETLVLQVVDVVGLNAEQMNASFHKSWFKIRNASLQQLVAEQVIHYVTTYGFEALGMYNTDTVYIPGEHLDVPLQKPLQLTVINGLTQDEIKDKLLQLLNSGIALKEQTVRDACTVAAYVQLTAEDVQSLKNKEAKAILFDYLNLVPENPTAFLRYVVALTTDSALLIKNTRAIDSIKEHKSLRPVKAFQKYEDEHGLARLAEIFYRFKPLFLAFKAHPLLKPKINKIRKLAEKHHKPMPKDVLNQVTARISKDGDVADILEALKTATIFRKIRLAYALKFRTTNADSIIYRIRNGRSYLTEFTLPNKVAAEMLLSTVLDSIVFDLAKNVAGKKIFVPSYIEYALPATEKQFTGDFPSGTTVKVERDLVFGVHWNNVKNHRVDIDLSLISAEGKYGWDGAYRNDSGSIVFSGDMTDGSGRHGASELFYVKKDVGQAYLLMANYFTHSKEHPVPVAVFVAQEAIKAVKQNHMVSPNNVLATAKTTVTHKQNILGLMLNSRFYFFETALGNSITSGGERSKQARDYLTKYYENTISFNELLIKAGAEIVSENVEDEDVIDLSPANVTKTTFLDMLR